MNKPGYEPFNEYKHMFVVVGGEVHQFRATMTNLVAFAAAVVKFKAF